MNLFTNILKENTEYNLLKKYLQNNENCVALSNVIESQKSHIISSIYNEFNKTNLIICEDEMKAKKYYDDLKFFIKENIFYYPSKDIVFYSADVKSSEIIKERFKIIKNIIDKKNVTIILSIEALFDRLVKKEIFEQFLLKFKIGDTINIQELEKKLIFMGYERVSNIEGQGQFSIRGYLIDIFSPISENGFRIELFDNEIDSIRSIDNFSKRSIENLDYIEIFPMRELVYTQEELDFAIKNINYELELLMKKYQEENKLQEKENIFKNIKEIIEKMKTEKSFSGIDKYIQFFYKDKINLLHYLPKDTIIYIDEPEKVRKKAEFVTQEFYESIKHKILKGEILSAQYNMIFNYDDIIQFMQDYKKVLLMNFYKEIKNFDYIKTIEFNVKSSYIEKNNINALYDELRDYKKKLYKIFFLSNSTIKCERLEKEFNEIGLTSIYLNQEKVSSSEYKIEKGIIYIVRGSLNKGFEYIDEKVIILADKEIFGEEKETKKTKKKTKGSRIQSFTDLKIGDYVVHENHGIAIFKGIEKIVAENISKDYLKLGYDDGGILYISINQLDMIQKYISAGNTAPKLNKLDSKNWNIAKNKAKKVIENMAKELLTLYAKRENSKGFAYSEDNIWQKEFEDNFPFQETNDQLNAIQDVKKDMESTKAMDRLICGDVGFGKTEVAIRASFKAVQDKKQVAFLVPTTILANQHFQNFKSRMEIYGINVALLSRFRTPKQQKETIKGLESGEVDVLIGTHRILSKDIKFKDLGLVIVDEEQRFGVRHKEKLKSLKENIDILTLSATPIPRTLHMSMTGIRDMSVLEEPPKERMPVQTYVLEYDLDYIRNAINRELARDGQVYYLHNRVHNIEEETEKLRTILPDARIGFAHGQMSERELENIMQAFMLKELDVLVCTTIIETGLDISNVNTIIINDADRIGLSQLYQLRGRVGRSNRTSFAYLMYKKDKVLQENSEKRLQTIKEFTEFGSGFKIAIRDLEIRGAGNLLGQEQHGHMDIIGYEMYCKMLDNAIKNLKGEKLEKEFETLVDINVNAFITDTYIEDESQKLEMYKKIASIKTEKDYYDVFDELLDRFGNIPKSLQNLLDIALMKSYAHNIGINKISQKLNKIIIYFNKDNDLDLEKFKKIINENQNLSFDGNLIYTIKDEKSNFIKQLQDIFKQIA